jgi:hypothetical protein
LWDKSSALPQYLNSIKKNNFFNLKEVRISLTLQKECVL